MKQKLYAWQEEVEKLAPLQERVDQLEGERTQIQDTNRHLHQQIQQLEGDLEKSHTELSKKTLDYNTLNECFTELQETRVNLENELQPLLEKRASISCILRENAQLLEGSDPKKHANLKKEHEALQTSMGGIKFKCKHYACSVCQKRERDGGGEREARV